MSLTSSDQNTRAEEFSVQDLNVCFNQEQKEKTVWSNGKNIHKQTSALLEQGNKAASQCEQIEMH